MLKKIYILLTILQSLVYIGGGTAYSNQATDCSPNSTVTLHSQGIETSALVTRWEVNLVGCAGTRESTGVIEFEIESKDTSGNSKVEVRDAAWENETGTRFIVEDRYQGFTEEQEPEAKNPRLLNCGCV